MCTCLCSMFLCVSMCSPYRASWPDRWAEPSFSQTACPEFSVWVCSVWTLFCNTQTYYWKCQAADFLASPTLFSWLCKLHLAWTNWLQHTLWKYKYNFCQIPNWTGLWSWYALLFATVSFLIEINTFSFYAGAFKMTAFIIINWFNYILFIRGKICRKLDKFGMAWNTFTRT